MKKKSSSIQAIVNKLVTEIAKGKTREQALSMFVQKWQKTPRTFDRYWKKAKEIFDERQRKASEASDAAYIEASVAAAKNMVMTRAERMEVLSKIARGSMPLFKPFIVDGTIQVHEVAPDWNDRKGAIAELNKMEGDYAPQKNAFTDSQGNDLPAIDYESLTTEELLILKKINKKIAL